MIVGARLRGQLRLATMIGWHAEAFARTKQMKPLDKYLAAAVPARQRREQGASAVLAMFRRHAAKQAQANESEGS